MATTTKDKKASASKKAAAPAKKTSPLTPDSKGNYPFILYSVKNKTWMDMAKKPKPTLTSTNKGAYVCKAVAADNAEIKLSMIVSSTTAENWVKRGLAEFVEE